MSSMQHPEFLTALGESFSENICPPVAFDLASPQECCEAVWECLGKDVSPAMLAGLNTNQLIKLADTIAGYFECDPPTLQQVQAAIAAALHRWPLGSLGETQDG